ncbi:MAG: beta-lactamase family protein [Clostridium sp.]|nr:beta-lactamase family protein [Clostridium sp.]
MALREKVRTVMERAVENCEVAGVNLLVEKDGEEICYCQAGMADREAGRSMDRDTILRLYSQTKPVTAAAAMILLERGLLDIDQPVSDFLPSFGKQFYFAEGEGIGEEVKPVIQPMRVYELLRMTSGLVYPDEITAAGRQAKAVFDEVDRKLFTEEAMTTREIADRLGGCTLAFEPGSSWRYGSSADVLGAVIEVVSGMRFGDFLEKEIFGPLGMKDTAFWVPEEKRSRLAAAYETVVKEGKNTLVRFEGRHLAISDRMEKPPAFESGGAGLASTLDDYVRFARMLLQGRSLDGVRILQPATVRYMTGAELMEPQQRAFNLWPSLEGFSYGNLMRVCKNPGRAGYPTGEGEYGWDGWLGSYFANFPKENMTILMGIQKKDAGTFALTRKLRNAVLTELL